MYPCKAEGELAHRGEGWSTGARNRGTQQPAEGRRDKVGARPVYPSGAESC